VFDFLAFLVFYFFNWTSKKNVNGWSTDNHDNTKFRTRSMEKQRGMAFGFRKTASAVKKTGQIDR